MLIIQTFVDVGTLSLLLNSKDHQIIYGRRGTGKTHALNYLADSKEHSGDAVVVADLRNIGSNIGLYANKSVSLPERATHLLVDTLFSIHSSLLDFFIKFSEELDLSQTGPALDELADSITQVKVIGNTTATDTTIESKEKAHKSHLKLSTNSSICFENRNKNNKQKQKTRSSHGQEKYHVTFGRINSAFIKIVSLLKNHRCWILLDEWSSIPIDLQPYLADLLRRCLFPIQGITVKIAAIEHRSSFMIYKENGSYIGIEVGADASANIDLDDFMVFNNDSLKSQEFFKNLLTLHILSAARENNIENLPKKEELINSTFTEKRALEEFTRSCEGVPRDAINIIALAAQKAVDNKISVHHIRTAANLWYQRDKEKVVSSNLMASDLLHWIIDIVIGKRKASAFLLKSDEDSELIDSLYDSRALHILKRSVSSHDQPGVRYDVYKLDYGCYVNLLSTTKAPQGLLPSNNETQDQYIEVPPDDYRSIRRAILKLNDFEKNYGTK